MKTAISGIIAAVMALSVFATAGFAYTDMSTYYSGSGTTMFAGATAIELGGVLQNIQNIGTLTFVKQAKIYGDDKLQISELASGSGETNIETQASWVADTEEEEHCYWIFGHKYCHTHTEVVPTYANIVTQFSTGTEVGDMTRIENTATDPVNANVFAQSIYTTDAFNFGKSIGINMGTDCEPEGPTAPVAPSCGDFGCWWI